MKQYKVTFEYEEIIYAEDPDDAVVQVGMNSRILECLGSDAEVKEVKE
jgi:hypothetical protein|tara:strand:- start:501 stop:644 length:144 start_codon:yes stop_codon:yes gene_type:complete